MFRIKDNEARRTRALKKAKDTQEMCKVRDKEIERQVIEIALNLMCMTFECFISERELTFTFAICYRPSVCRLSVVCLSVVCRLSVVCNVRAPYSGGSNFRQYFYGIKYLGHPLTSTENFTEIVPGKPLRRGS